MRSNQTLKTLKEDKVALGTWIELQSIPATRLLAAQGCFQWLLIDLEHNPIDYQSASMLFSSISDVSQGIVAPIARVPAGTIDHIKQVLDAGAQGIMVPMVNTAQEAADAVKFAKYPPDGVRGVGGVGAHLGFGASRTDYLKYANKEILVSIQIETKETIQNIDEILDVKGIDAAFIGPSDLHQSLGLPTALWSEHSLFQESVKKVRLACKARGIPLGTLCANAEQAKARVAEGFTFVAIGSDRAFLLDQAGAQYGAFYDLKEPPEAWRGMVNLGKLDKFVRGE